MQQSIINRHIASAYAKSASILGVQETLFRPTGSSNPTGGTPFGVIMCAYDVKSDFDFKGTMQPNHAYASLLADPTLVEAGDYLVGDDTHFIARVEPFRPALCVLCNETVDFLSTDVATTAGTNAYGGHVAANDAAVAVGWPVSMAARTRASTDVTKLPSDTKAAYYDVLAPPIPGVTLYFGMRITDAASQAYEIISAELSQFGWKLVVGLATT